METKHTPGPWKIKSVYNGQQIDNESGQMAVAHVWDFDTEEATKANAKLIAAAPENIELDIEFMDAWAYEVAARLTKTQRTGFDKWLNRKRAAIKKATA